MKKIEKFVHVCKYTSGGQELSHEEEIGAWEVENRTKCLFCGEVKATPEEIIVHIYDQLTNE